MPGAFPYTYLTLNGDRFEAVPGGVVDEMLLSIFVNAQELATLMCSPLDQEALAIGFLYNEGVIRSLEEIRLIRLNASRTAVDIFLNRNQFNPPRRMVLTSGCSGGVTFQDLQRVHPPLQTNRATTPETIFELMRAMKSAAHLYNRATRAACCWLQKMWVVTTPSTRSPVRRYRPALIPVTGFWSPAAGSAPRCLTKRA